MKYIPPKFNEDRFTCPHCNTVAHQIWTNNVTASQVISQSKSAQDFYTKNSYPIINLNATKCEYCNGYTLWIHEEMKYPRKYNVPEPNGDMPKDIKLDYIEAGKIVEDSPRCACSLLRLALQKLMIELGEKSKDLIQI